MSVSKQLRAELAALGPNWAKCIWPRRPWEAAASHRVRKKKKEKGDRGRKEGIGVPFVSPAPPSPERAADSPVISDVPRATNPAVHDSALLAPSVCALDPFLSHLAGSGF